MNTIKGINAVMIGLDAGGKTTMLYKLKLGEVVTTIPTIGFNVETVEYKDMKITIWDIGGQDKIKTLWRHYYQNCHHAVIFVLDATDRERFQTAVTDFQHVMTEPELNEAVFLILANKMDLPSSMTLQEIATGMSLHTYGNSKVCLMGSCAITGDGLNDGLEWIRTHAHYDPIVPEEVKEAVAAEEEKKATTDKLEAIRKVLEKLGKPGDPLSETIGKILGSYDGDELEVDETGQVTIKPKHS